MKIGQRLTFGFTAIGIIFAISMAVFLYNMSDMNDKSEDIINVKFSKNSTANYLIDRLNDMRIMARNALLFNTPEQIQAEFDEIPGVMVKIDSALTAFEKVAENDTERKFVADLRDTRMRYEKTLANGIKIAKTDKNLASETLTRTLNPIGKQFNDLSLGALDHSKTEIDKAAEKSAHAYSSAKFILFSLFGVAILIIVILTYFITRSITKPIDQAVETANHIADGRFDQNINITSKDETAVLLNSLIIMRDNIKGIIEDINHMSHEHDLGDIDVVIDINKYKNEYKELSDGINKMVNGHLIVKKKAMACIKEFGEGNFDAPLEKFPGKKVFINDTIEQVRANLKDLISEVGKLIVASENGNMQLRADTSKHKGDFLKITKGFNDTLELINAPLVETLTVLNDLAHGKLDSRMVKEYKGDFLALKTNLNKTIDSLPLSEIMKVMAAMSKGDLTVNITGEYQGDNQRIKNAVNDTLVSLNEILNNVKTTVDEVTRAAMQVSDTSMALSQGATQQAASLEEITSSMGEIGSQTRQNADNANIANTLANNARNVAEKGNSEMGQLTNAMTEINKSSTNISRIIRVIDDIAFQTNLLALNAAVEAARAGRHGKGFAVVAEEVRSLASRSAKAAQETSEMIELSIKTVDKGSDLVQQTGEALSEIQSEAVKVADIIGEINTSSNEQALGISQINEGLNQIDKVTQTNTASAEESASAAEELSSQAGQLRILVDNFKLTRNTNIQYEDYAPTRRNITSSNRSLPSSHSATPVREEDFYDLMDNPPVVEKRNLNPSDIISLDEDEFDRY